MREAEALARISLAQWLPPPFVLDVPADGCFDTVVERDLRMPAQFQAQAAGIDGVSLVVPRAISHVGHQISMRRSFRLQPIQTITYSLDDLDVGALVGRPDIVFAAGDAEAEHAIEC